MANIEAGISVIMATYNQASFIRRAIAGLYAQIHTEWELIIINDGSTDCTEWRLRSKFTSISVAKFTTFKDLL
jgi:glycosyltransferase involved in cell wall biosynthesis